jgi:hypothetical protein
MAPLLIEEGFPTIPYGLGDLNMTNKQNQTSKLPSFIDKMCVTWTQSIDTMD